jgi:heptosyltransferase-2
MNILVRGTNWIGDAVMTVPALRRLRGAFPDSTITLLTRSWAEGIFRDSSVADRIVSFDKTGSKVADVRTQVSLIRSLGCDAALLFTNSFESALVARLAGVPRRFGYATDARRLLLTDPVPVPAWKEERHEVHYYLELVASFARASGGRGVRPDESPVPDLQVSDGRRAEARGILSGAGLDPSRPVVALGVGSTNSRAKRWPAERYAALAGMVAERLDAQCVLVGNADERGVADEVVALSRTAPASLVGTTTLAQAVAVLAEADAMVSNDMGLAHIAAAVGTPTLTVFGPTKDSTTRPLGVSAAIVRHEVECSPCMLRDCPIDHRCMTGLTPETVFRELEAVLRGE